MPFKFFKGCFLQILLGPLLNTMSQIMERRFSVLTFLSNEVQSIYIGAKLIRQTNAIISMKPYNYIWFIDRDEITDLDK